MSHNDQCCFDASPSVWHINLDDACGDNNAHKLSLSPGSLHANRLAMLGHHSELAHLSSDQEDGGKLMGQDADMSRHFIYSSCTKLYHLKLNIASISRPLGNESQQNDVENPDHNQSKKKIVKSHYLSQKVTPIFSSVQEVEGYHLRQDKAVMNNHSSFIQSDYPYHSNVKAGHTIPHKTFHQFEIQNIETQHDSRVHRTFLYSIDASGKGLIINATPWLHESTTRCHALTYQESDILTLSPPHEPNLTLLGATLISPAPYTSNASMLIATARSYDKVVQLYDEDRLLCQLRPVNSPTNIRFLSSTQLIMTEGNILSLWDLRLPSHSSATKMHLIEERYDYACIQRVPIHACSTIWAMDILGGEALGGQKTSQIIAVGGTDRCVSVIDTRKINGTVARWDHCVRQDLTHLRFSSKSQPLITATGMDQMLTFGNWKARHDRLGHLEGVAYQSRLIGMIVDHEYDDRIFTLHQAGEMMVVDKLGTTCHNA